MMNLFLDSGKASIELIIKSANDNDLKITENACIAGVIAIFIICVTIYLLTRLSHEKKDKSTKRILEDFLKNDKNIATLLKEKITASNTEDVAKGLLSDSNSDFIKRVREEVHRLNTEDVAKGLLSGSNSDFIKRVSEEVHRLNTEKAIKEVLNEMIDKEDSELIKNINDKLQTGNNNPQEQ